MKYTFDKYEAEELQNLLISASIKTENEGRKMPAPERLIHCILNEILESKFDFCLEKENRTYSFDQSQIIALYWLLIQTPVHRTNLAEFWSALNCETANIDMKRDYEIQISA